MRETDYVELAFWAGWVEALNGALSQDELSEMRDAMRLRVASMVEEYLSLTSGGV